VNGTWPWILIALLGAYHGLNPAMGWLFAVGLGLQERDRRAVWRALPPIAIGHELAIAVVVVLVLGLELVARPDQLHVVAGAALVGFGIFRFLRPRAHPRWARMRVNRSELTLWSFLMSSAHGAGLMVAPVLIGSSAGEAGGAGAHDHGLSDLRLGVLSIPESALAVTVHVGAMLLVMAAVAVAVYETVGVSILRKAWINLDAVWAGAFVLAGVVTLFT
jgi:hypothetical protein